MVQQKQKILICTYYWPPSGGSGVQRWLYFAKHLKNLNWEPIVITVRENLAAFPEEDKSLLDLVKGIRVYPTKTKEPLQLYSRIFPKTGIPKGAVPRQTFFQRLAAWVRGNFFIPDARKGWVPFALTQAKELLTTENISQLVTTGPPHSTHLIGLSLKKEFDLHWIVDFRDPWSDLFYNKELYRSRNAQQKDKHLERIVLETADTILTTVGGDFHQSLQEKVTKKLTLHALPNGYDAELMAQSKSKKPKKFHFVFAGLLTKNQAYREVLNAIQNFVFKNKVKNIRWTLAGSIDQHILHEIQEALPEVEIVYLGYVSHEKVVEVMKSAHLLLNFIFEGAHKNMLSGKLIEYLATQNPVLSIGEPHSPAGKFLAQGSNSKMIRPNDSKEIVAFIEKIFNEKEEATNYFPELIKWSREALTKRLSEEILLNPKTN
ncbi:MAG: hypothetical protein ISP72_04735 [Flavobacteriaceae bacterium]|nr:hypothetical protein [Flavobacteriaceae bacterium]